MADIGSILLPDPNLVQGYEKSFERQMALKQYVYRESKQEQQQFAKDSRFAPDADLMAFKGQSNAMSEKVLKYQQHAQALYNDHSRGGMFQLDPKAQAELAAEKYELQKDQAERLGAITRLTSVLPTIRRAGFSSSYNSKYTENWMKQLNNGEIPVGEPIQALPKDGSLVVNDIFKSAGKPLTTYSDPVERGNVVRGTSTSYLPDIAGKDGFTKDYKTKGYEWYHNKITSNPATAQILNGNFDIYAQDNPEQAKQLVTEQGPNAPYALHIAQHKDEIEAKMLGVSQQVKPILKSPDKQSEADKHKVRQADSEGNIELGPDNIIFNTPSVGKDVQTSELASINLNTKKAYVDVSTPANAAYGIPAKKTRQEYDYEKALKLARSKGLIIENTSQRASSNNNSTPDKATPKRKLY